MNKKSLQLTSNIHSATNPPAFCPSLKLIRSIDSPHGQTPSPTSLLVLSKREKKLRSKLFNIFLDLFFIPVRRPAMACSLHHSVNMYNTIEARIYSFLTSSSQKRCHCIEIVLACTFLEGCEVDFIFKNLHKKCIYFLDFYPANM